MAAQQRFAKQPYNNSMASQEKRQDGVTNRFVMWSKHLSIHVTIWRPNCTLVSESSLFLFCVPIFSKCGKEIYEVCVCEGGVGIWGDLQFTIFLLPSFFSTFSLGSFL